MAETKTLQFLDLAGLAKYDSHSKIYIDEKVSTSLKGVAFSEDNSSLLFYTELPVEGASPAYELELPKTDISGLLEKFASATAGNVITVAEDGKTIVDSGTALTDLAKVQSVEEIESALNALKTLVGELPTDTKATTVNDYIKELADEIKVLKGDSNVEGSVKKTVADEIAKIVADAPESFDTLKEISDWISSHETDAAGMNSKIQANTTAIDALKSLVGELPEGASSTTVVEYIAEALEKADLTKYALASDLKAAVDRIAANENAIKIIDASLKEGGATYNAIKKAQETGDSAKEAVNTLSTYVGHFTVDDEESVDTIVAYINYKVSKITSEFEEKVSKVQQEVADLTGRVDTLETDVETNTTNIESLQEAVASISAIPAESIEALFKVAE